VGRGEACLEGFREPEKGLDGMEAEGYLDEEIRVETRPICAEGLTDGLLGSEARGRARWVELKLRADDVRLRLSVALDPSCSSASTVSLRFASLPVLFSTLLLIKVVREYVAVAEAETARLGLVVEGAREDGLERETRRGLADLDAAEEEAVVKEV
jgi:hypothetical protein